MIDYRVRSVSLVSLVNEIKAQRLIPDAYFQRNLVWREIHKKDFIKTILLGLPFPQIFISKGKVDVDSMQATACIVDGQQRTNAILDFINGSFDVSGKFYQDLTNEEKSEFLKYEVAVIELDLENDNPKIIEIFQRINRTSNSLTTIEKAATQYASSEYMCVAKLMTDELYFPEAVESELHIDPNVPDEFIEWAKKQKVQKIQKLMLDKGVFTPRELSRKVHLMHVLNIMSAIISGYFNRNEKTNDLLDDYALEFDEKDAIVQLMNKAAEIILNTKWNSKSYWLNKANIFTLMVVLSNAINDGLKISPTKLAVNIKVFEETLPEDYKLSASEAVNSTRARNLRAQYLQPIVNDSVA
ncbi:DUF262 domain-containing protein [Pseudomonas putida]|uniref:DUF262 domain-containing protein n=1 Tax=Pseudomonas putida TaxID=303 RepID=UPI001574FD57|nr:DUF262 domain-containing protein [Pseudomonas putida]NTY92000.1 DUF262 domain-containing protein [Pseudomonas putida]NTY99588.1 DUF262 domain-containing protein [Pseudomonas putida]NTZ22121.1 DUF262 domain-containing protein [Pseudomonas putida]NTZ55676.1 DUF262 domain-containing protein [Pseudomonas putida]NTZ65597.1 DUF262 domain-containing protein [Pseudomonas putida]